VVGADLEFHLVHGPWDDRPGENADDGRNVIVKGATSDAPGMSEEADEVEAPEESSGADEETEAEEEPTDAEEEPTDAEEGTAGQEQPEGEYEQADEAADAEAADADTEDEAESLQDGDFVRIAYTARTVEGDQLVDTTDPDVAEEEGVDDQGEFEPRVIVLGEGHLFPAVEDDIRGSEVGESGTVTVSAAEAFGEYDEEEVRTVSADKIPEDDRRPGAQVTVDGDQGYLETIIGGRARVDFNHPLAGEDIEYDYELLEEVEDDLERAQGLLNTFLDMDLEMHIEEEEVEETRVEQPDEDDEDAEPETVTETVEKTSLYVESTPQLSMNQQWMFQKQQIAQQITRLTNIDRIVIQEVLDGGGMGMGGMMGGMGGMGMGGGGAEGAEIEEALEEADIDADEIVEEIEEGE
jgi:FKBP-type peptidyl-prolyl cis-trans isomerase SlyD